MSIILGQPCAENPCQNEGKCNDIGGKVSCACLAGYHGDRCEQTGSISVIILSRSSCKFE